MRSWIGWLGLLLAGFAPLEGTMDRSLEEETRIERAKEAYSTAISLELKKQLGLTMVSREWPSVDPEIRLIFFEAKTAEEIKSKDQARTLLVRAVSLIIDHLNKVKFDPIIPQLSDERYSPENINITIAFTWPTSWWRYFSKAQENALASVSLWHGIVEYTFVDVSNAPMQETYQEAKSKVANFLP